MIIVIIYSYYVFMTILDIHVIWSVSDRSPQWYCGVYQPLREVIKEESHLKKNPKKTKKRKEEKMSVAVYLIQYFEIVPNISLVILSHFFLSDTL